MAEDKNINLSYRILRIQTTKFSFLDIDNQEFKKLVDTPEKLKINVNVSLDINKDDSSITLDVYSQLINANSKETLVEHSGKTSFYVDGLENAYIKDKEMFNIPDNLLIQLYSISYTHSRALLATELNSTPYRNEYFLPVIDPKMLIKGLK